MSVFYMWDESKMDFLLTTKEDCGNDSGMCSINLFVFPFSELFI